MSFLLNIGVVNAWHAWPLAVRSPVRAGPVVRMATPLDDEQPDALLQRQIESLEREISELKIPGEGTELSAADAANTNLRDEALKAASDVADSLRAQLRMPLAAHR